MITKKQLFINLTVVVVTLVVGIGVIWAVQAEDIEPTLYYQDTDSDGFGDPDNSISTSTPPEGYVIDNTDCNDSDAAIHPGAEEVCDSIDNNCDNEIDEDVKITFYYDADGDDYGISASTTEACLLPEGYADNDTDCDDINATVNPSALEICDEIDNNCDNNIDESCATIYYYDADSDDYGDPDNSISTSTLPEGYTIDNTDCNDSDAAINPGAEEICDGVDNNCDGTIDEGCTELNIYYQDADSDDYGDPDNSISTSTLPEGYTIDNTDCNDSDAAINPGADEVCDGVDNDCDGEIDENVKIIFYYDADSDDYGTSASTTEACLPPEGYADNDTDCNDTDAAIHPGALEICDGIDNNCDGVVDEDLICEDEEPPFSCEPFEQFRNHGAYVSCMAHYTNYLKGMGEISGRIKGLMMSQAAHNKGEFSMTMKWKGKMKWKWKK